MLFEKDIGFEDWFRKNSGIKEKYLDFLPCSLSKLGSVDGRQGLTDTQISGKLQKISHQACNKVYMLYVV